jgi:GT2 family glycosyltransferase
MTGSAAEVLPTVYAIIVNYNGWRDTVRCLESLLRVDYPDLRVMVLENGSSDGSLERLREWARGHLDMPPSGVTNATLARLVEPPVPKPIATAEHTPASLATAGADVMSRLTLVDCGGNLGFAGANNIALRMVSAAPSTCYALLLNNDAVIASDALRAMVALSERTATVGAVGATILEYERPDRVEALGGAIVNRLTGMTRARGAGTPRSAVRPATTHVDYLTGSCVLLPQRTLRRVGLMDEQFFLYGEDVDWGLRILERGLELSYCPTAEVWHRGGGSVVHHSPLHDYYDVRGRLMMMRKHFPAALPVAIVYLAVRCVLPKLVRGEWTRLGAALRAYRDFARLVVTQPSTIQAA